MKKLLIILALGGMSFAVKGAEAFYQKLDLLSEAAELRALADKLEMLAEKVQVPEEQHSAGKFKSGKLHRCSKCSKEIRGTQNFKSHMNSHDAIGKYECPECGTKHKTPTSRTFHRKREHGVSPFSVD